MLVLCDRDPLLLVIVIEISDKAWGHSKKAFYNTDYIDEDVDEEEEEEEEILAQEEERESLALQRRMAESLQDHDFGLSYLPVRAHSVCLLCCFMCQASVCFRDDLRWCNSEILCHE